MFRDANRAIHDPFIGCLDKRDGDIDKDIDNINKFVQYCSDVTEFSRELSVCFRRRRICGIFLGLCRERDRKSG